MPYIVAVFHRLRTGRRPVDPAEAVSHAEYYLWVVSGERPSACEVKALDVMLVIYAERSMNNSAFTAVSVASTLADMYAAVTAAVASLKGPLHGGQTSTRLRCLRRWGASRGCRAG
jgi:citrate synthase